MTNDTTPSIPFRRFWLTLLFQTALILAVHAQAIYTHIAGKIIILQTAPLEPYNLLRGYSQIMRYDISSQEQLRGLPGWNNLPKQQSDDNTAMFIKPGTHFYVILAEPISLRLPGLPQPWEPISISLKRPANLNNNQVFLRGIAQRGLIEYGLENYTMPEAERNQINDDLRAARLANPEQTQQIPPIVMEVKVDAWGNAVPISLWVQTGEANQQKIRQYRL
ncbi:MAG: GDYXXLXY domain-containing protein [Coleofasciculus sp. D1-CHI-01]|uniref:GDYXXLXY domain-containing protein n=1 Tax=Coleofasciculus sp. D1-CHI-01 TaxID=3068482 RepID=UPI003303B67B